MSYDLAHFLNNALSTVLRVAFAVVFNCHCGEITGAYQHPGDLAPPLARRRRRPGGRRR